VYDNLIIVSTSCSCIFRQLVSAFGLSGSAYIMGVFMYTSGVHFSL